MRPATAVRAAGTFDDVAPTNVALVDDTKIQARVPANDARTATISITNADGTSSTLTYAFRYAFDPSGCNAGGHRRSAGH